MLSSDSFVERSASVSSMRRMNVPSLPRASSQLKSAVRALPTWSWPVGLGAKRHPHSHDTLLQQGDRVRGDGFAAADGVDAFVGLALDAHAIDVNTKRAGEAGAHRVDRILDFWTLQDHGDVEVADLVAVLAHHRGGLPQQLDAVGVFPTRVRVGEVTADVAQPGGAEDCVRGGVARDVGIGMAERAAVRWECHAGDHQATSVHQPVQVVPRADAQRRRPHPLPRRGQIVGGGDFHVSRISVDDMHLVSRVFGEGGLVGAFGAGPPRGDRGGEHGPAKPLRRLREVHALARDRFRDHASGHTLHGIARLHGRDRRAVRAGRLDRSGNQIGAHERASRVMDEHHLGRCVDRVESIGHGVLPPGAPRHQAYIGWLLPRIARERNRHVHELERQDQDNLRYLWMLEECRGAVLQDRSAADVEHLFRPGRTKPSSGAARRDDGTYEHLELTSIPGSGLRIAACGARSALVP